MSTIISAIVLAGAAILQSALLPHFALFGVKVDLVLLLVVTWSIRRGVESGLVWAMLGGVSIDLLSAGPFGMSIVVFAICALIAGVVGPSLRRVSIVLPLLIIPVVAIVAVLTGALVLQVLGRPISWPVILTMVVLPSVVLDSLAGLVIYPLVSVADHRFGTPEWQN
jgi:rod shape-determining protein MreD